MPNSAGPFDYPEVVPPGALFVAADEPMLLFPSVEAAERGLEADDVRGGTYSAAFGPRGETYRIIAVGNEVIVEQLDTPAQPDDLRELILQYLDATGRTVDQTAALADLVQAIWAEEARFWRENDPYGERFGTRIPLSGCLLAIFVVIAIVYLLFRRA